MNQYVDVILPLPLAQKFTYVLPEEYANQVSVGSRVVVPFGRKKYYTGLVVDVYNTYKGTFKLKAIHLVLDSQPIIFPYQLDLWKWISSYYMCSIGDVYKAALPSGLKIESETWLELNADYVEEESLSAEENKLLDLLHQEPKQRISKIENQWELPHLFQVIEHLIAKKAIRLREELQYNYRPKTDTYVFLSDVWTNESQLKLLVNSLKGSPKQLELLMKFVELSQLFQQKKAYPISRKQLLETTQISPSICKALVDKGVFTLQEVEVGRLELEEKEVEPFHALNFFQQQAFNQIENEFKEKEVCLLHGVTSSGKTEIYIHLIQKALKEGKQVLYLLPEIALTTQITQRLQRVFGNQLGVYHSKCSDTERVEIWKKQLSDTPYQVILGVRSSIFLPFQHLGLIIIDEEHESTYKQQDPAPRYHARNTALVLASMLKVKTVLGTATPAIETWFNTTSGKYGLVQLNERYKEIQLPEIVPVDIYELQRKKRMVGQFSPLLLSEIEEALQNKEQVILFQNRRGFAPMLECKTCGWVPKCEHCDVSLTYHKGMRQLACHYCGSVYSIPSACPACEETDLRYRGFGTEKVEDDIRKLFPEVSVGRMDLDTTRNKNAYEQIISDFEQGKTQILIGTQMVSKGLDFDHVRVVGILNADTLLNYPDFRSYERAFQLMAQVAGRAGRKGKRGRVILQTRSIEHPIIHQVMENDYEGMVNNQLLERKLFRYPPYYRLIYIYLRHQNEQLLKKMAQLFAFELNQTFGARVLGPSEPPVARVQRLYIQHIVLKVENESSIQQAMKLLHQTEQRLLKETSFRSIQIHYDVDPM